MTMRVNQRAIAKSLNLSTATVSKSLRNHEEIHPQTRAQVIQMATQLGYRPAALRLDKPRRVSTEMRSICLILQTDSEIGSGQTPHATSVLAGMSEAAHQINANVSVHYVPWRDRERLMEPEFQPAALREGRLSGVVLQHYFSPQVVRAISQQLPCVYVTRQFLDVPVDSVDLDAPQSMDMIVRHLHQRGHRRIGFLGAGGERAWEKDRFCGYLQAMISLGLPFDPRVADPALNTTVEDVSLVNRVVADIQSGVTAWVTPSDSIGYLWCQRLMARGLRIPQDVSITGVDAFPGPTGCPRLTSVRVPFEAMGRAAVTRLIDRIREPAGSQRRICFEGHLSEGETVATV